MTTDYIAHDDDGSIMTLYTINTISPVEYETEAKELSLFHLVHVESSTDTDVNTMLPLNLYDINTGIRTHVMCARPGYQNTIRNQQATMLAENLNGATWVSDTYFYLEDNPDVNLIKSKMCFVLGDKSQFLNYLGLEER
jgi:hypothetical protein